MSGMWTLRASLLFAGLLFLVALAPPARAQAPPQVPAARYYGWVTVNGQPAPYGASVVAQTPGGVVCGSGFVSGYDGSYSIDLQPYGGCAGTVGFSVNGQPADQPTALPNLLSGAVALNLTVETYGPPYYPAPPPPLPPSLPAPPPPPVYGLPPAPGPYGATISYPAGWNLVSGPAGTRITGTNGPLFTLQPGDASYETLAPGSSLQAGLGYWVLFNAPATLTLPPAGLGSIARSVTPGQMVLIGNPFASPATVSGATAVYTYDPVRGYQRTSVLQPGQGAWATSASGSIVISAPGR
jgi:hypothetical protein